MSRGEYWLTHGFFEIVKDENMLREIHDEFEYRPQGRQPLGIGKVNIKVVGVGGGGSNAVNRMYSDPIDTVDYIVMNTDAQALELATVPTGLRVGDTTARGMGVGGDPSQGRICHEENREEIAEVLDGADLVFVTAGMGGGTGTGGAPVVAQIAKQIGALTIGVCTMPFSFEGTHRTAKAEEGVAELQKYVDTLIRIPNDRLLDAAAPDTTTQEAWRMADKVLKDGVEGIARVIIEPGEVNLDFADVRAVMTNAGPAWMGVGQASDSEPGGSLEAVQQALESPLLDVDITGAQRALVNITGGPSMRMYSVQEISSIVQSKMTAQSNIILGTARQPNMGPNIRVIVIATGFPTDEEQRVMDTKMIEKAIEDPESMKIPPFLRNHMLQLEKRGRNR